ncbi:MAG: N-myristoyltransferase [Hyperionvirus sp.]|uniref:glycylpeptide N-tetradecanoyltransferase n=1 Tax=Hyperionvirus sp. TaxID=2487770 RepID=A0A3G5A8Z1_9VIRU|nr:MAG: N-myristoyltransferase [Hyperionvirus sp.]
MSSQSCSDEKMKKRISKIGGEKLSAAQYARMLDYVNRRKNGEQLPDFILDHPTTKEEAKNWDYKFWSNRLVPKLDEPSPLVGIIDAQLKDHIVNEPIKMFEPYEWFKLDSNSNLGEVVTFLNKYYNADSSKDEFRPHHTAEYMKWSLGEKFKIIGIRAANKIGAVVAVTVKKLQVFSKLVDVGDVNYLCIHPHLREKGIAPKLIDEVIRQLASEGVIVGMFATDKYIPNPFCRTELYNRPLNYERLCNAGFIKLERNVSLDKAVSTCMIQYKNKQKVIKMDHTHHKTAYNLLCTYQDRYNVYRRYTFEEFLVAFSNSNIVSTYVILNDKNEIDDFYSFYKLAYHVLKYAVQPKKTNVPEFINAAYMNIYTSLNVTQLTIFKAALLSARDEGMDIFICSDMMENLDVLFDNVSKFTKGSKYLHYNFYNMKCPEISPQQVCF